MGRWKAAWPGGKGLNGGSGMGAWLGLGTMIVGSTGNWWLPVRLFR